MVFGGLAACATEEPTSDPGSGTLISAATGGIVRLGADVTLAIPPGSLAEDAVIGIAADVAVPGEADGFTPLGAAFRFSPAGTQFELARPAILTMRFDPVALAAMQLDARTLELAYLDEALGRYFSVGGEVDWTTGTITARVEHFTLYLPMAAALAVGNNPPTVALQATVPTALRAGAPVYVRATIRDYDVGGSVAGAQLEYRQAGTGVFTGVAMHPETTLDTFAAIIPANGYGVGAGNDLEYRVTARDNLGAATASATVAVDVVRTYAPGSLALTPGTQAIAAGFDKLFAVKGTDDLAVAFALVPESATATHGTTATSTVGVTFSARAIGSGEVQVHVGADTGTAIVNVSNGALASVAILDDFGQPIEGTLVVREGSRLQFDAVGEDAWGNQVLITPTWARDANLGAISTGGLLDTLDGSASGAVTAQIGDVIGTQWLTIVQRVWATVGVFAHPTTLPKLTSFNGVPYLAYLDGLDGLGYRVRVQHQVGATWVDDGFVTPNGAVATAVAIGAGPSRLQVVWAEGPTTSGDPSGTHIYAAHLEGTSWVRDGGALEVDPEHNYSVGYDAQQLSIAFDGNTPYVAFSQNLLAAYTVYVKHWNGSAWIQDGGQLQDLGYNAWHPSIGLVGGTPYVAFEHWNSLQVLIVAKRWTGAAWQAVGSSLNYTTSANGGYDASLAVVGGMPTVAYKLYVSCCSVDLYVAQWDGDAWNHLYDPSFNNGIRGMLSGGHDVVTSAAIASDGAVPYVSWIERPGPNNQWLRRVAHWNPQTSRWTNDATWSSVSPTDLDLAVVGTTPYLAQEESDGVHVLGFR